MKWWGTYTLERNQWAVWRVGPLSLHAQPRLHEWNFAWERSGDKLQETSSVNMTPAAPPDPDSCSFERYVVGNMHAELVLEPRLGDRPFIVRPESPLFLLSGQTSVLYVSTPVWVTALFDSSKLIELAASRPSDTWFGPNTREGELCYATLTAARTELAQVGRRAHRAVTPVEIRNEGDDTLAVQQLRVPVPALSLHHDNEHRLWTDAVHFVREEDEREASLIVREASTHLPDETTLIAGPRRPVEPGTIVDAFSRLLG